MSRAGAVARALWVVGWALVGASLTACGGGDSGAATATSSAVSGTISRDSGNATIQGIAPTTAVAGQPYSFAPQAADSSGSGYFTVTNLPAWANFDTTSGEITGTPTAAQVGTYSNIVITLVDAGTTVSLPAFNIMVTAKAAPDAVILSWQAPTENADGTPLLNLKGYEVHYGKSSQAYTDTVRLPNPGITTYVVQNLPRGTYYFAITAFNSSGVDSSLSEEVSTTVD
jgi:Putative Ig domain